MDENVKQLINDCKTLLCLFKNGYLLDMHIEDLKLEEDDRRNHPELEHPPLEGYAIKQLNTIFNCMVNYLGMMYYPSKYRNMLYTQLVELKEINDSKQEIRRHLIKEALPCINEWMVNDDYWKGFIITTLKGILGNVETLEFDEHHKKSKRDLLCQAITDIYNMDKKDDPDDNKKRQIYTDVYDSIMPTVSEAEKHYDGDPEVKLWYYMSDVQEDVDEYKPDGFSVYEFQMKDRKLPHDPIKIDTLVDIIDTLVKWADYEIKILQTHIQSDYFMVYQNELNYFIEGHDYYKGVKNIVLQYPEILFNEAFVDNVLYIFQLRADTENLLRKELALLIRLISEDCFTNCEQLARNYSDDKAFYETLKDLIETYPGLCNSDVFYSNVRFVFSLNERCAKRSLRKAYVEFKKIFDKLDEKG